MFFLTWVNGELVMARNKSNEDGLGIMIPIIIFGIAILVMCIGYGDDGSEGVNLISQLLGGEQ
jgi:hypothetical protein